jgi:hypothetical protein
VIIGGLGWLLGRWLGLAGVRPLFFVFTLGYMIWKMFVRYDHEMRTHGWLPGRRTGHRHELG